MEKQKNNREVNRKVGRQSPEVNSGLTTRSGVQIL